MKIAILGGGLSGCTLAYLLRNRGHKITLYEKQDKIGGLCQEAKFSNGVRFHPFGPHIFHTSKPEVISFIKELDVKIKEVKPKVKSYVEGKLVDYPINLETTIPQLKDKELILTELEKTKSLEFNPPKNFKEQVEQLMGPTLYDTFIRDYTTKQWGCKSQELDTSFAPKRIYLNEKAGASLFSDTLQGYVSFNELFKKLTKGVDVQINKVFHENKLRELKTEFDLVISTIPIDKLFYNSVGLRLKYRQMIWTHIPTTKTVYEDDFMCVNYPNKDVPYTRIAEMKKLTGQDCKESLLTLEIPGPSMSEQHYPFPDKMNSELFERYLKCACIEDKVIMSGRLGLYVYLNMDEAISVAIQSVEFIEKYKQLSSDERFDFYMKLRQKNK